MTHFPLSDAAAGRCDCGRRHDLPAEPDAPSGRGSESGCEHCGGNHTWNDCSAYTRLIAEDDRQRYGCFTHPGHTTDSPEGLAEHCNQHGGHDAFTDQQWDTAASAVDQAVAGECGHKVRNCAWCRVGPEFEGQHEQPDYPAATALAQHIADHPVSAIQAAMRLLGMKLTFALTEDEPDALTAVRDLHTSMRRGGLTICAHCAAWDGRRCHGAVMPWPCPTAQAIGNDDQEATP